MVLLTCVNKTPHFTCERSKEPEVGGVLCDGGGVGGEDHKTLSDLTSLQIFPVSGVSYVAL